MSERLLLPGKCCPRCGMPPAVRIPEAERELAHSLPPSTVRITYRCHRQGCNNIYPLTAADYQRAA